MSEKKYTPCGGCGAETPLERCIGCFHPFESTQILKPKAEAFYWLNLADHFTEDWMLFHCRYTKDKMKLDTDSFELSDGWLIKKNGSGMLDLHEVEYLAESIWVLASSRLPNKDGIYKVRRMYSEGENKIKYSSGKFDNGIGYTVYEWLDEAQSESPAEQPVDDSELKQEVDHLEKKISMCEEALEKLHAERYETRLALRMLLKVFKNDQISKDQEKYYSQAETILEKHGKVTDVLRTGAAEQPGREVDDLKTFLHWLTRDSFLELISGQWTVKNDEDGTCPFSQERIIEMFKDQ